jgi:hypothetical protein
MSVLTNESAVNPDKNLWALASASSGGKSVAGTTSGTQSASLNVNTQTTLNTYNSSLPGTYVVIGSFQWITSGGAPQLIGAIFDLDSGITADATVTQPTGITSQGYSASCVMTLANVSSVRLRQSAQTSVIGCTCKAQWTVLFFPA